MDNELYDYSPIIERDPIHWPDGARVAFYVGLNVEHFLLGRPSTSFYDGMNYLLDWTNDDQPYWLNVPGMLSVPYSVELNDLGLFTMRGLTGPQFLQTVTDQFDQPYADSASSGRVMALALHPFAIGQPFRAKYLDRALEYITGHPGVWLTTSDEIAAHFARVRPQAQPGQ